jgi:hypothetical protein
MRLMQWSETYQQHKKMIFENKQMIQSFKKDKWVLFRDDR